jgi:hypothetical protein
VRVDLLVAPRRYALDAGAMVKTRLTATGVLRDAAGRVSGFLARTADGEHLRPRCVAGADDLCSRMAGWVGAATPES